MLRKVMMALFGVILISTVVNAQAYLGPQLGWQKASDADSYKLMFGGAFRTKLSESIGLEASINYRQEEYDNGAVKVSSWPVMVTGLIYPVRIVYGAVGIGWYNTSIDYSSAINALGIEDNTSQNFGWHFGGGVEIPLSGGNMHPGTILTGDVRYVFLNYDFHKFPGSSGTKNDYIMFTVGLLFNLK